MHFKARLVAGQTLSGLAYGFWLATAGIYFIDKGLELWIVGLILGLGPVVTAALEVPFGMLADRHGRLRIYRLSVLIISISLAMLSLFHSVPMFIAASVLGGIGQALQSGSLDAWYVQQLNQRGEGEKLEILSGHLQAAMAAGMAVAAIAGGYTPDFMPNFMGISGTEWNPLIASGVLMAVLLLSYGLYFEGEEPSRCQRRGRTASIHWRHSARRAAQPVCGRTAAGGRLGRRFHRGDRSVLAAAPARNCAGHILCHLWLDDLWLFRYCHSWPIAHRADCQSAQYFPAPPDAADPTWVFWRDPCAWVYRVGAGFCAGLLGLYAAFFNAEPSDLYADQ
jgi:hypothetical protein